MDKYNEKIALFLAFQVFYEDLPTSTAGPSKLFLSLGPICYICHY